MNYNADLPQMQQVIEADAGSSFQTSLPVFPGFSGPMSQMQPMTGFAQLTFPQPVLSNQDVLRVTTLVK